jgi:hypothetical protein
MGPTVDSRIKPPDAGIRVLEPNLRLRKLNIAHHLSNVMKTSSYHVRLLHYRNLQH